MLLWANSYTKAELHFKVIPDLLLTKLTSIVNWLLNTYGISKELDELSENLSQCLTETEFLHPDYKVASSHTQLL